MATATYQTVPHAHRLGFTPIPALRILVATFLVLQVRLEVTAQTAIATRSVRTVMFATKPVTASQKVIIMNVAILQITVPIVLPGWVTHPFATSLMEIAQRDINALGNGIDHNTPVIGLSPDMDPACLIPEVILNVRI